MPNNVIASIMRMLATLCKTGAREAGAREDLIPYGWYFTIFSCIYIYSVAYTVCIVTYTQYIVMYTQCIVTV